MTNLEKRNLGLHISGSFISVIGSGIQNIALPLYILHLTGSGFMMGIISLAILLPSILATPFAAVLGDRKNRKKIMVLADLGRGTCITLLGLAAYTNTLNIPMIIALQVVCSVFGSFFGSVRNAVTADLVSKEELPKAISLLSAFTNFGNLIGPALGGVIYSFFGIGMVFILDGLSYYYSFISRSFISYKPKNKLTEGKLTLKNYYHDFVEGLSFIVKAKGLLNLIIFFLGINLISFPIFDLLIPYILNKSLGFSSQYVGYAFSTMALGFGLGSILAGYLMKKWDTKKCFKVGWISVAIVGVTLGFFFFPGITQFFGKNNLTLYFIIVPFFFIMGMISMIGQLPIDVNIQKMIPADKRSRVLSISGMISNAALPLGSIVCGFLIDRMPAYIIFEILCIMCLAAMVLFVKFAPEESFNPEMQES